MRLVRNRLNGLRYQEKDVHGRTHIAQVLPPWSRHPERGITTGRRRPVDSDEPQTVKETKLTHRSQRQFRFARFTLLVLLASVLAACGASSPPQGAVATTAPAANVTTAPDNAVAPEESPAATAAGADTSASPATAEAATTSAASGSTGIDPNKQVTLTMWAAGYTPSHLLPTTGENQNAPQIVGIEPVVEAYEKLHPNVDIQLIAHPSDDEVRRWMITQLTGGEAPDIMWTQPDWAAEDYRKNWWVPLDEYLQQPNPYIAAGQPGSERWVDLFQPQLHVWKAPNNSLYVALADQIQVGMFYNKDMFEQAGIAGPPKTWEEWMQIADKLKAAGMTPFAVSGQSLDTLTWVSGWLTQHFYWPQVEEYDTDGDKLLSKTEMAQAVKNGSYSFTQDRNKARLEQLKRWSSYWQTGAAGIDSDQATRLFVTGRAAMMFSGSWFLNTLEQDPQRKFEFGVFYYPTVDFSTSPLVPDGIPPTNKAAGYGSFQYAVTNSAVKNGNVDVAMDFLKFATVPENLTPMIEEGGSSMPAVKGAGPVSGLEGFQESVSFPQAPYQSDDSMFDFEFGEKFLAITSPYFSGGQSLDETAEKLQVEVEMAADRVLAEGQ